MAAMKIEKLYTAASAITNVILQSQTFGTSWTAQNITVGSDTTVAPDGTVTADTLTNSGGATTHIVYQQPTIASGNRTISCYAKAGTNQYLTLSNQNAGVGRLQVFDLSDGSLGEQITGSSGAGSTTFVSASCTSVGNGWYRCVFTVSDSSSNPFTFPGQAGAKTGNSVATAPQVTYNDNTDTLYVWGFQVETGTSASNYVATTTASVTAAGTLIGAWTKDANAQTIRLVMIGGGGSGAGGARRASGTVATSGGGGGGGGIIDIWLGADQLGATETYTVGAAVSGGPKASSDNANGSNGNNGNATTFTIGSGATTLTAYAGGSGTGGSSGGGGAGLSGSAAASVAGANGGVGGGAGATAGTNNTNFGCGSSAAGGAAISAGLVGGNAIFGGAGGGSGGGKDTNPTYFDGGAGGGTHLPGGAAGTNAGTVNGTAGKDAVGARCGSGGGGGAAHNTVSGAGGAGGTPGGGGGGGGATINGQTAGDGGSGARGEIWVISYLDEVAGGTFSFWVNHAMTDGVFRGLHPIESGVK
jgi:hypothetical protein